MSEFAYVVYAKCGCRIAMRFDEQTAEALIETARWLREWIGECAEFRRVPVNEVVLDGCWHGQKEAIQQKLF